jgi:hypothetical protein
MFEGVAGVRRADSRRLRRQGSTAAEDATLIRNHNARPRRTRRIAATLVVGLVLAGLIVGWIQYPTFRDDSSFIQHQAANAAIEALTSGDLDSAEDRLAANRGKPDFAYFFASQASPRVLGDALGSVAGEKEGELKNGVDAHRYELALTDLAGTLALATHGTGDRALPTTWASDFATATTIPDTSNEADEERAQQDQADKQNLLLLLARGYWSTEFLETVTKAYWTYDHDRGDDGWPVTKAEDAKYAPAPNGTYLTDGILALTAALTANSAASSWAFTEFQPGTQNVEYDGDDHALGHFTHYLFFEHQFPKSPHGGDTLGMTATLTALSSAIDAEGGPTTAQNAADAAERDLVQPMADARILQGLAKSYHESSGCSFNPLSYGHCVAAAVKWLWDKVKHWGHTVLDILSLVSVAALFAVLGPEAITGAVVIGGTAAAVNAAWYAIDGDYAAAGLSFAAIAAGPIFKALATAAKAGVGALKAAKYADEVANAANASSRAAKAADELARAEEGAAAVVKGTERFSNEGEFEEAFAKELKGSTTQDPFRDPTCTTVCRKNWRKGDVFHAKSGSLFELKVGRLNKSYLTGEIERDLKLRASQSSGVKTVKYVFAAGKKGNFFPDDDVRLWLKEANIPYVICTGKVSTCVKAAMATA